MAEAAGQLVTTGPDTTATDRGGFISGLGNLAVIKQVGLMIGLAAAVALGVFIALWSSEPAMRPLAVTDPQSAVEIVEYLDSNQINYRMQPNGTILVPQDRYTQLQVELAGEGILLNANRADELIDRDPGFGVSQRLEQARLLKARELNLERTIEKFTGVKGAEVHLAIPRESVFLRDQRKPSASVLLNLYAPKSFTNEQVRSIVDLVANSIPELDSSRVTITDQFGRLHHSGSMSREEIQSNKEFAEVQKRQAELRSRIEQILEPILGMGKYSVQVNVDMDFTRSEQTQQRFNPDGEAVRSEHLQESQTIGSPLAGVPGALTNQPPVAAVVPEVAVDPVTDEEALATPVQKRSEVQKNYDLDTTISHVKPQVGTIQRITVSLAVDYVENTAAAAEGANGEAQPNRIPRSQQELDNIASLIRGAIGFNAGRGDVVEIESFPFIEVEQVEPPEPQIWEQPWFQMLLKPLVALIAILLLIFAVLRPIMKKLATPDKTVAVSLQESYPEPMSPGDERATEALNADSPELQLPPPGSAGMQQIEQAKMVVGNDPALVAQVVKNWVDEDE